MISHLHISVVMPAYNEAALLEDALNEVVGGLRSWREAFEVHVVENGSTDGTRTIAQRIAASTPELIVHTMPVADYGEALRTGLLESRGNAAVIFNVDYFDLGFLKEALSILDVSDEPVGPVVVVGSKRAPGSHDQRPRLRRVATSVFSALLRHAFSLTVSDTHGMKALNRQVLDPLVRQCLFGVDLFDTELIIRAERAGWHVAEVPVTVHERRPARTSVLRRVPRTLWGLVRLRTVLARRAP